MSGVSKTELLLADATIELAKGVIALSSAISRVAKQEDNPTFEDLNRAVVAANEALAMIRRISEK